MLKSFCLLLVIVFGVGLSSAQAQENDRKAKKQAKKEAQAQLEKERAAILTLAIDSSAFVLEADRLQSRKGRTINVSSNLNFIAVEGDQAFIQIGSNYVMGYNGVGGISVDGRVTKLEINKNEKRGGYSIRLMCMSSVGTFDISINSNADGQIATATVASMGRGKLTYQGKLVPVWKSTVYKGTTLF